MRKVFLLQALLFPFLYGHAQLTAYFSHCIFNTPDNKPYIETYLTVFGNTIAFKKNSNGKFTGMVEVGILFSADGKIKASKKYNLTSPEINDSLSRPNFIDLQRFGLDTGTYELELLITDKNINGKTFSLKKSIQINFLPDKASISDIELVEKFSKAETNPDSHRDDFTKSGYNIVPYTSDFFPDGVNEILFYAEIYNTKSKNLSDSAEKILIRYYIESYEKKNLLPKYIVGKREQAGDIHVLISKFDITDLLSGNYNLVVEARNKNNELMAQKKVFFQRKNMDLNPETIDLTGIDVENTFSTKITSRDTLKDLLRSLRPVASGAEKNFIDNQVSLADVKLMQQFLYNFWQTRNNFSPEDEWNKYEQQVKAVNAKFGTFIYRGYEADRGRVYLQYGPPDKREEYPDEPNAYPYEIWIYYKLVDKSKLNPMQTNKKFIFYSREKSTNNFQLLHSDALSELHDSRWEMKLHARTIQSHDFEKTDAPKHFGGNAEEEFNNPK